MLILLELLTISVFSFHNKQESPPFLNYNIHEKCVALVH